MSHIRRAVVLGGGGYAASAWETGLITGLADTGLDLRDADLFVGTSSGSRVALHLASGVPHQEVYQKRLLPGPPSMERPPAVDWVQLREGIAHAKEAGGGPTEILRRYGALALAAATGRDGSTRREIVAPQLPMAAWPEQNVLIVAVNAETGERRAFDRASGISLVDAVIATTASFGWPPILFEGHHYFDGGYYSSDNADLAAGFDRVLVLSLQPPPSVLPMNLFPLDAGVNALRDGGAQVELIQPDEEAIEALAAAGGLMSPAISAPAARAGRAQGARIGTRVASFWT